MTIDWQTKLPDSLLDDFVATGFVLVEACFDTALLKSLQQESGMLGGLCDYQQAKLTHGERVSDIRGDSIRWIDEACMAGWHYLQAIEALGKFFNCTLFTGIRHAEAHYARYPNGFGYDWHTDNPKGRDERVISAVLYLNENWQKEFCGELLLTDKTGTLQIIEPKANRLVIFDSNLSHKVAITYRERFSIATWLRRD